MRKLKQGEINAFQLQLEIVKSKYNTNRLRTVIYARKSAIDERQTSLPTQISECKEFVKQYDFLELTEVFQEDNRSGMFMDNRTEFLRMLEKAEKHEIDVIVVLRFDRFARDMADMTTTIKLLRVYGCSLIAGDDIAGSETPAGEFTQNIIFSQNQYQARVTASRVMESEIHNAKMGYNAGGKPPYGIKIVNKQFEIDEDEAPAIRIMFNMIANGSSYKDVIEKLDKLGYKTRNGISFTHSTMSTILRNDKYYGTYVYNREGSKRKAKRVLIEKFNEVRNGDAIRAIISKELFDKVQKILDDRKVCRPRQNENSDYFLTGYVYCKGCGSSMSGKSSVGGRQNKRSRYYVCLNHSTRRSKTCKTKDVNADYLETAVKETLVEKINSYLLTSNANSVFNVLKKNNSEEANILKKRIQRS